MFLTLAFIGIAGCSEKCDDVNCLNGGACNDGTCVCPDGFRGEFCQTVDPCADITCQNGGTCLDGTCDCPDGFSGEFCETEELCAQVVCENGGTCVNGDCDCTEPYTGTNCQTEVRAAFIGNYTGSNNHPDCQSFTANILAHPFDPMRLLLHNVCSEYNLTLQLTDSVNFSIVTQSQWVIAISDSVYFNGFGHRNPTTELISITFTGYNPLVNVNSPMTLYRQ